MIIGVDLDEVLAEFFPNFLVFFNKKYKKDLLKENFTRWDFPGILGITREEAFTTFDQFGESELTRNLQPMPGSKQAIGKLAEKHTLHVITHRPIEIAQQTEDWIKTHFQGRFSGIHFCSKDGGRTNFRAKSLVCKEIGAELLIDDHPDNARLCSKENIQIYLFDQPWNRKNVEPHAQITRIFSWHDIAIRRLY